MLKVVLELKDQVKALQKEKEQFQAAQTANIKAGLLQQVEEQNGVQLLAAKVDVPDGKVLKNLAHQIHQELSNSVVVLGSAIKEKPQLLVMVDKELAAAQGISAREILNGISDHIEGRGGGNDHSATGGGKKVEGLEQAVECRERDLLFG